MTLYTLIFLTSNRQGQSLICFSTSEVCSMLREENHGCVQFVLNGTFTWLQPFSLISTPHIAFHLDRVYIDPMNMHRDKTISVFAEHDMDKLYNFFAIYYQYMNIIHFIFLIRRLCALHAIECHRYEMPTMSRLQRI